MTIDKKLINELYDKAVVNPRLRINYDLRNSELDLSQRMLNAMMPGTKVDIHRHPNSSESVIIICGSIDTYYEACENYGVPGDCGEGGLPERSAGQERERERELPCEESGPVSEEVSSFTPARSAGPGLQHYHSAWTLMHSGLIIVTRLSKCLCVIDPVGSI